MAKRAVYNPPDYILNVGDNFYWAGLDQQCGNVTYLDEDSTGQWARGFEAVYRGPNLEDTRGLQPRPPALCRAQDPMLGGLWAGPDFWSSGGRPPPGRRRTASSERVPSAGKAAHSSAGGSRTL
ncbi:unnamed protein product [Prorocentrum cordatum]|uniref:Acid phosphatase n=1 Tax=Prorocentrum cordatum TaxID=2364126 RepID=A0ABN9THD3_9DINO|nr:unnamed protein product [Polarella glacialis]